MQSTANRVFGFFMGSPFKQAWVPWSVKVL
jgi:hypothetical protein